MRCHICDAILDFIQVDKDTGQVEPCLECHTEIMNALVEFGEPEDREFDEDEHE